MSTISMLLGGTIIVLALAIAGMTLALWLHDREVERNVEEFNEELRKNREE